MKSKNLCALFLLSLASVYFICPVQCAVIQEAGESAASDEVSNHHQHRMGSQAVDETNQSTCCESANQLPLPHERQEEEEGYCCFSQWESLGTSEPQLALQIQKDTFLSVVLIPTTPSISPDPVSFTTYLQPTHKRYTDTPIPQLSPRAPPFFLS